MASTYSNLKIELIGTGDQSGTWGVTTNTNLGTAIEEAITGSADVTFASADVTLTLSNTNTSQTARNLRLNLVGTVSAVQNLIVPNIEKQYIINNTLGYDITVKNSTGTGVAVPAGKSMIVFNTGTNVVEVVTALATGTVIPVANGGTGVTTSTGTGSVVLSASPTLTGSPLAPTQTAGDNSTKIATTAYVATAVTNATGSLGTMSTQNANNVAITGGTIAGTAITGGSVGSTTINNSSIGATTPAAGTFTTLTASTIPTLGEKTTIVASPSTGTINYDVITQSILYYTSSSTANWTINIRGDGTTSLNTLMAVGETRTITYLSAQNAGYYASTIQIDGSTVTPRWQGGSAPTIGASSGIDVYTFAIIKTASSTYTVLASLTSF